MKRKIIFFIPLIVGISVRAGNEDETIFTDYCQPGLCDKFGGDGVHSGCKDGVRHDGKFQYPPCPDNAKLIPLTDEEKEFILHLHNVQRNYVACGGLYKKYGLRPGCRHAVMTWDKELEETAYLHTSYCLFEHDKCHNTPKYPLSGQNLGMNTFYGNPDNTSVYLNVIAYLWYLEYIYTNMDLINAFYDVKDHMVGHFLTSVNERNNRVGCTFASFYLERKKCDIVMLSCNYPITNILKAANYRSCKEPASKCTTGTDARYKFLCSADEKYDVSSSMKNVSYDGDGTEVFKNCGRKPEFLHFESEGGAQVKYAHGVLYPDHPLATEEDEDEDVTTKKPDKTTTKKPAGGTTGKPGDVSGLDNPEGNLNAGGEPDYSDDQYDQPDSSTRTLLAQAYFYLSLFSGPLTSMLL